MRRLKFTMFIAILLSIVLVGTVSAATGKGLRTSTVAGSVTSGPTHVTCGTAALDVTVKLSYRSVSSRAIYVTTVAVTLKVNSNGQAQYQTLTLYQQHSGGTIYNDQPTGVEPLVLAGQTRTFSNKINQSIPWSKAQADYLWADQQYLLWSDSGLCGGSGGTGQQYYWYFVPGTPL